MNAIFLLLGIVSIGTLTSIVPMMIGRGFSPQEAAQIAGVTGLAAIAGRGGIGWVLDRVHPPYVIAGIATIALGAFLLVAYGTGSAAAYLTAAMLGAVVGAEVDFTAFFVRRYFGGAVFGRLYGLAFGIFIVGSGTGPLVSSAMFDAFEDYRPRRAAVRRRGNRHRAAHLRHACRQASHARGEVVTRGCSRPEAQPLQGASE